MDITLADLLIIESRLMLDDVPTSSAALPADLETTEVSWAVSVRATPPHLPVLRGGELVLVPDRIGRSIGPDLAALIREAALRKASAALVPAGLLSAADWPCPAPLPILSWPGEVTPDIETTLNRQLTECRGELYRLGGELERQLADLGAMRTGVEPFVRAVAASISVPMTVSDSRQRLLAASAETDVEDAAFSLDVELPSRSVLRFGPLQGRQRIVARFFSQRIAAATEVALRRDDEARPRGSRRVEATAALLADPEARLSDQRAAALALGLDPDATFYVAASSGADDADVSRALDILGNVYPAGTRSGQQHYVIELGERLTSQSRSGRVDVVKHRWENVLDLGMGTLAISAPVIGVAGLPGAAREARFVTMLQARAALAKRAASFESVEDVGAFRLLYELRDSDALRRFATEVLGPLEQRDRRGTLRGTLRAFLESGGSHVEASQRLGIHRNTLAYRLRRIGELVGHDVADPSAWLTLHLAIRASDLLQAVADGA